MTFSTTHIQSALARDGAEMSRSFFAGAGYMLAVVVGGGLTLAGGAAVTKSVLPAVLSQISAEDFPKYSANDLEREVDRQTRWNGDRWSAGTPLPSNVVTAEGSEMRPLVNTNWRVNVASAR